MYRVELIPKTKSPDEEFVPWIVLDDLDDDHVSRYEFENATNVFADSEILCIDYEDDPGHVIKSFWFNLSDIYRIKIEKQ